MKKLCFPSCLVFCMGSVLFCLATAQAQSGISGQILMREPWRPVLFISVLDDFEREFLSDSIQLDSKGFFTYLFRPEQKRAGLIRLTMVKHGWGARHYIEGEEENNLVIPLFDGMVTLQTRADAFYYSHVLFPADFYGSVMRMRDCKIPLLDFQKEQQSRCVSDSLSIGNELTFLQWQTLLKQYRRQMVPFFVPAFPAGIRLLALYHYFSSTGGRYDTSCFRPVISQMPADSLQLVEKLRKQLSPPVAGRLPGPADLPILVDTLGVPIDLDTVSTSYIVLDFWASWCSPCRKAIRSTLPLMHKFFSERDILLVGVNEDASLTNWYGALREDQPTWRQYRDPPPGLSMAKKYNISGYPMYIVLNKEKETLFASSSAYAIQAFLKERLTVQ